MDAWVNGSSHAIGAWLFGRALAVVYAIAFISLAVQIKGLVGRHGILPAREFLSAQQSRLGRKPFWLLPSVCWWWNSDRALQGLCWCGGALSALLFIGVAPVILLVILWLLYLSLFHVGQIFLGYQWDVLLLETGFFAIFLAPFEVAAFHPSAGPSSLALAFMYWILFRLMFFSGVVKLRSGDRTWRNLTALCHHYQTQPLPTPAAWFAWRLPARFHRLSAAIMFGIELGIPILIFAPQPLRSVAAIAVFVLMLLIQATGNFGFFNIITMALALLLIEDSVFAPLVPITLEHPFPQSSWPPWLLWPLAAVVGALSLDRFVRIFRWKLELPTWLGKLDSALGPFHLVNPYGLFAVMTTERPEIIVEGSDDGQTWRAYEFKFKAGDVSRALPMVAPHQPRLDWQMWFAALGDYQANYWFTAFLNRLLEGRPEVRQLLAVDPFQGRAPKYIRAVLYDYRFTDWTTKKTTGAWWQRERKQLYCPVLSLRGIEKDLMPPKDFV